MWKDYSRSYIKNNRASSMSIAAATFIAAMFLALLCSIAYNFWVYEIEKITLEEGGWQGRIIGGINENDLSAIQNFPNVKKAVINEKLSAKDETAIDIYFQNPRTIYRDMPLISAESGVKDQAIQYHSLLLLRYFIHDPQDEDPPKLLTLYLGILLIAVVSLILIIRNSFELSMNARIHQFGIFSSIGATPKQIRICLLQEAVALSFLPVLSGMLSGTMISYLMLKLINIFAADVTGRHEAVFHYHIYIFLITFLASAVTVFVSAWAPSRRLSRITPLEAIRNTDCLQLKKKRHSSVLLWMFGVKGELAGNALKAQKKSLRLAALTLLLSFLGFSVMLMFTALADISTRYTYFERYQDAWDIMITLKDTAISDFKLTEELRDISGIEDIAVYQKAEAATILTEECQSDELTALGGFRAVAGIPGGKEQLQTEAPLIILDDTSFLKYCSQAGIAPGLDGVIVLNRIWDSVNSNFRYKEYVPFLKENKKTTVLCNIGSSNEMIELPVLSYTQTVPVLREEYADYGIVHFIPLSMWKEISGRTEDAGSDSYIRIFSSGNADSIDLDSLEKEVTQCLEEEYEIESENRIQERLANDRLIDGMKVILGALCVLLAGIGIANVFLNTLGFLSLRKREFAQYMSVGLTPRDMRQIFCIEAFVIAGRPILITVPLTILFVQYAVSASYLDPMEFWTEAPVIPIVIFGAAIAGFVALAYYIGGKRILQCDLNEILRNDTFI